MSNKLCYAHFQVYYDFNGDRHVIFDYHNGIDLCHIELPSLYEVIEDFKCSGCAYIEGVDEPDCDICPYYHDLVQRITNKYHIKVDRDKGLVF